MAALDGNVVNVALPIMARVFRVSSEIRWVTLAYLLPTTALLGAFGALSDIVGRKLVTLLGVMVFVVGSALCGISGTLTQMILFRVVQGIGGAAIGSAIMAIATVNFEPGERGRAMAVVTLIAPLGAVTGPSVGGLLIGALGWPSIFYINVPVGVVAVALIARFLPGDNRGRTVRFDGAGAVLFTVALFLLVMGLSPQRGRLTSLDMVLLAGCLACAAGFVLAERRASDPLVPLALLGRGSFSFPVLGIMTMAAATIGLGFLLPFYLEGTLGLSPERAGLTLLFFPLGIAAASQIGGRLTDRFQPRLPAAIGSAVAFVGFILLFPLDPHWTAVQVAIRLAVGGIGTGFFLSPSNVAAMSATPSEHVGVGGAIANTARYLGFALGPTLATILWSPDLEGPAGLAAMRTVLYLFAALMACSLVSVLAYRARRRGEEERLAAGGRSGAGLDVP